MSTSNIQRYNKIVQNVVGDLPAAIAVAVVDTATGLTLASHSNSAGFSPEAAAAHNAEVVKQELRAMQALKLEGQLLEEVLITLSTQLHVIKIINGGGAFVYLAVDARTTNLGIAREVLREHISTTTSPALEVAA